MRKLIKPIFLGITVVLLSHCSLLAPVKTESTTSYVLNTLPKALPHYATHHVALFVTTPLAESLYNTNLMAYSNHPYRIAYFAKNNWAEPPAQMLHPLILKSLQKTHYFSVVSDMASMAHFDFILNTQLIELRQVFLPHSSYISLSLNAQLVNVTTTSIVSAKQFHAIEFAPYNNPYGGVIAANRALARVLRELTLFCVKQIH